MKSKIRVTVTVHRSIWKIVGDICDNLGTKKSRLVEKLLLDYIKDYDKGDLK